MAIIAPRVCTSRFTWDGRSRTFSAEASDFNRSGLGGRVYDDACDFGFILVSEKTRKEILCLETSEKRDGEGELLFTRFLCFDLRGRPLSGPLGGAEVHLYND